jgi:hypothetical protein
MCAANAPRTPNGSRQEKPASEPYTVRKDARGSPDRTFEDAAELLRVVILTGQQLADRIHEAGRALVVSTDTLHEASIGMQAAANKIVEATSKMQENESETQRGGQASTASGYERSEVDGPEPHVGNGNAAQGETLTADENGTPVLENGKIAKAAEGAAFSGHLDLRPTEIEVAAADIEASVQDFHYAATVLDSLREQYPMVQIASVGWAPLDFSHSVPAAHDQTMPMRYIAPWDLVNLARRAEEEARRVQMPFTKMPVPQARGSFAALLADFLKVRLEAVRGLIPLPGGEKALAGTAEVPGLEVIVHTRRPNLRIYQAPVYFPATRTVFGNSLSTPVRGFLPPGLYIFGADGENFPFLWEDEARRQIPPNTTIHLVRA